MKDEILYKELLDNNLNIISFFIDTHQNKMFNFCFKMTNNYHVSEDLTQEIFLQFFKSLKKFKQK